MEHWQFLIQKQGDRSWQSLESPNLKISAGKYRVLARSPLPNTDVEVRVTHSSIQEVPPKQRVFKRLRRTDTNGLMAVIPFTDLQPGIWEIRCSGDLMTDMLGESWQHSLLLNVLSSEAKQQLLLSGSDNFDDQLDSPTTEADKFEESPVTLSDKVDDINTLTSIPEETIINQPVNPVLLKGETAEQIVQNLLDLALPSTESWDEDPADKDVSPPVSPPLPLQLSLERDTYIAQWGTTLQINGDVFSTETENSIDEISSTNIYQLRLVTELRSPLESAILTTSNQILADQFLPFTFSSNIQIPRDCESKLILGNINLYGTLTQDGEITLLGNHPFSITADVTELLTITSQTPTTPDLLTNNNSQQDQNLEEKSEPVPLGLELFNLVKTPKLAQFRILKPAGNITLPPRIKSVILSDKISPKLPKLPRVHKSMMSGSSGFVDSLTSMDGMKKPSKIRPINLEKLVIKQVKTSFPYLKRLKLEPEPETQLSVQEEIPTLLTSDPYQTTTNLELTENTVVEIPQLEAETSININYPQTSPLIQKWMATQGYFLDEGMELVYQDQEQDVQQSDPEPPANLNHDSITVEELVKDLNADLEAETADLLELPEHMRLDTQEATPVPEPDENTLTRLSEEIVLDDVHITPMIENQSKKPELPNLSPQQLEFLPTPQLFLPGGELLAGTAIKVRLEMSQASSAVVIKLWVEDYQTRVLLDGPHLLGDLRLTPWGNWEATTQIIVPLGCVEMLVGAIALDMNSKQESHKVTMVKTVIPPDLSTIEVDEVLGL